MRHIRDKVSNKTYFCVKITAVFEFKLVLDTWCKRIAKPLKIVPLHFVQTTTI